MQYEKISKTTTKEMVIALLAVLFVTFGLYVIGIIWGVHQIDSDARALRASQGGSIPLPGATTDDLPLQGTVNGADLQGSSPCLQGTCYEL